MKNSKYDIPFSRFHTFTSLLDNYQEYNDLSYFDATKLTRTIDLYYRSFNYSNSICLNNDISYNSNDSNYTKWKEEHEVDIDIDTPPQSLEYVKISSNMKTISDLLNVINNNEVNVNKVYNIKLDILHNIKDELLQLERMTGLISLKTSIVNQLIYFLQNFHKSKDNSFSEYKHTIITGPPGTGKTEIAKIIGKMYSKIGVLKSGKFKKVTRSDLIGGYLGQTALKTKEIIDECLGGVIFIDEAYSLHCNDPFAKECIDTLCESMSDNKDDLMVIVAGYENELNETIFKINKGMRSRFIWTFNIEDYKPTELYEIFIKKVQDQKWQTEGITSEWFVRNKDIFKFNGRDVELLLTYIKIEHSVRVFGEHDDIKYVITITDLNNGLKMFINNRKNKDFNSSTLSMYT